MPTLPSSLWNTYEADQFADDVAERERQRQEEEARQQAEEQARWEAEQQAFYERMQQDAEEQQNYELMQAAEAARIGEELRQATAQQVQQNEPDPFAGMDDTEIENLWNQFQAGQREPGSTDFPYQNQYGADVTAPLYAQAGDENRTLTFDTGYTPTPEDISQSLPSMGGANPAGDWGTPARPGGNPDLVPNQFDRELTRAEALAACGPAAAVAFARTMGRNPTMREALEIARQPGIGWTEQTGMRGPASQSELLNRMGIPNRLEDGVNWDNVRAAIEGGNPVTISTPNHYFVVDAYNPETGQFHAGRSGTAYASGAPWLTEGQIRQIGGGLQGALYLSGEGMTAFAPASADPPVRDTYAQPGATGLGNAPNDLVAYARDRATQYGVDPDIFVRQITQESGWRTDRTSPAGAQGIAQIVPQFHPGVNTSDPYASLDYAARIMGEYLRANNGDYPRALATYNAGAGNVQKYGGVPPFAETQLYIRNILGGGVQAPSSVPYETLPQPSAGGMNPAGDWNEPPPTVRPAPVEEPYPSLGGMNPAGDWYAQNPETGPEAAAQYAQRARAREQAILNPGEALGGAVRGGLDLLGQGVDTARGLWENRPGPESPLSQWMSPTNMAAEDERLRQASTRRAEMMGGIAPMPNYVDETRLGTGGDVLGRMGRGGEQIDIGPLSIPTRNMPSLMALGTGLQASNEAQTAMIEGVRNLFGTAMRNDPMLQRVIQEQGVDAAFNAWFDTYGKQLGIPDVVKGLVEQSPAIIAGLAGPGLVGSANRGAQALGRGLEAVDIATSGPFAPLSALSYVNPLGAGAAGRGAQTPRGAAGIMGVGGESGVPDVERWYHGTGAVFDTPEVSMLGGSDSHGPAFYLGRDPETASSYAVQRAGERGGAPNVRPVDVPTNLRLLDDRAPIPNDVLDAVAQRYGEPVAERLTMARDMERGYDLLREAIAGSRDVGLKYGPRTGTEINQMLSGLGYDGFRYQIRTPDGLHEALALFPESLPQVRNALSGRMGGFMGESAFSPQRNALDELQNQIDFLRNASRDQSLPLDTRRRLADTLQEVVTEYDRTEALQREIPQALAGTPGQNRITRGLNEIDPFLEPALGGAAGAGYAAYGEGERDPQDLLSAAAMGAVGGVARRTLGQAFTPSTVGRIGRAIEQGGEEAPTRPGAEIGQVIPEFASTIGGAALGGATGYATAPEGASTEERLGRAAAGAVGGGLLGYGGARAVDLVRPAQLVDLGDDPVHKPTVEMFRRANAPAPLRQTAEGVLRTVEKMTADRWAALNRIGPNSEEAISAHYGRAGRVELVAEERIRPVAQQVRGLEEVFDLYVKYQRDLEVASLPRFAGRDRLFSAGIRNAADAQVKLADLETKVRTQAGDDAWERIAEADRLRTQAIDLLRDEMVENDRMAPELRDYLKATQPHYNPTRMLDLPDVIAGGGERFVVNGSNIKRLSEHGHDADTESPMLSFVRAVVEGDLWNQRNRADLTMIDELRAGDPTVHKVPNVRQTTGAPVRGDFLPNATTGTVAHHNAPVDIPGAVSVLRNGTRELWAVPEDIEKAMKGLDTEALTMLEKVFRASNEITRLGITTLSPSFLITNVLADAVTTFIREGAKTTARIPQGWWNATQHQLHEIAPNMIPESGLYRDFIMSGGGGAGFWSSDAPELLRKVRESNGLVIRNRNDLGRFLLEHVGNVAAGGVAGGVTYAATPESDPHRTEKALGVAAGVTLGKQAIQRVNEIGEAGPRLATFAEHRAKGETLGQAAQAGRRVTLDFARAGELVRHANSILMFFNANVQGFLTPFRTIRDTSAARWRLGLLAATAAGLYAYNRQFPEYQDVPQEVRDQAGVIMLPGSEKAKEGPGFARVNYLAIPLREWAIFTAPITHALAKMDQMDPRATGQYLRDMALHTTPGVPRGEDTTGALGLSPISPLKTIGEIRANVNTFTGRPIVPRNLEELPRGQQVTERTSAFAASPFGRQLGDVLDMSPVQMDHLVRGVLGTAGANLLDFSNAVAGREVKGTPVLSGLARGVLRGQGGQLRDTQYDRFDQEHQARSPAVQRLVEASPGYGNLTEQERRNRQQAADQALKNEIRGLVGLPTDAERRRQPDQPWKYRGVTDVPQELRINEAVNEYEDWRSTRQGRPAQEVINLGRKYASDRTWTPEYKRWRKGERTQSRQESLTRRELRTELRREVVGVGA